VFERAELPVLVRLLAPGSPRGLRGAVATRDRTAVRTLGR